VSHGRAVGRAILGTEGDKVSVQALIDGWNARDGEKVAAAFTPDGVRVEYAKPGARLEGRDAIAAQAQAYMTAVPDCVLDVRGLEEREGTATLEWTYRGNHTGDIPGLAASGREIELPGVSVYRLDGGLIAEERVYWDAATLYGLMD
jgi:steroid delta-isomerase-like uncharacterized protein